MNRLMNMLVKAMRNELIAIEKERPDCLEIEQAIRNLRNEVNCRIEHGANSGGHLDYVQNELDEILKELK